MDLIHTQSLEPGFSSFLPNFWNISKWSVSHQWILFRVSNASLVNIRQTIANENGDTSQCARISKIVHTYMLQILSVLVKLKLLWKICFIRIFCFFRRKSHKHFRISRKLKYAENIIWQKLRKALVNLYGT